jgi:hypothetical protein
MFVQKCIIYRTVQKLYSNFRLQYYNTKTLFKRSTNTIPYCIHALDVMVSIATTLRYYASQIVSY